MIDVGLGLVFVLSVICVGIYALALFHRYAEKQSGYGFFTGRRLLGLGVISALYHGAFFLNEQTSFLAEDPRGFYGLLGISGIFALYIAIRNFRGAGFFWGLIGSGVQMGLFFLMGPWLGAGLLVYLFCQLFMGAHSAGIYGGSPQTDTVYINNTDC